MAPSPAWFSSPSSVTTAADAPINKGDTVLLSIPVSGKHAGLLGHVPSEMFPFTISKACNYICANVKGGLFFSVLVRVSLTCRTLSCAKHKQVLREESSERKEEDDRWTMVIYFCKMLGMMKGLKKPILTLMIVTSINSLAWSMIFVFISNWMERDVYSGKPGIKVDIVYDTGYRYRNCGLMLNWFVMGAMSLAVGPIGRAICGAKNPWGLKILSCWWLGYECLHQQAS
ncbi:sucrose transport protein-like [Arachis hypogaea]|uniref:sucrose transport protein-like n=1 Tax=Arachis hypogaea TaxID=3818 RepID=UPI0007AFD944|nr:sucrose transport protein-like [Arachis hypogaea]